MTPLNIRRWVSQEQNHCLCLNLKIKPDNEQDQEIADQFMAIMKDDLRVNDEDCYVHRDASMEWSIFEDLE